MKKIFYLVICAMACLVSCEEKETPVTMENGHIYVDLGLSVKWATCNVGANAPEEYGDYFAWGEVKTKKNYGSENYKWGYTYYDEYDYGMTKYTKYCTNSEYGTVDNKTTLELSDDAASVNWGGSWRMPTKAELEELRKQCIWTWTTLNGVYGYLVTSGKSGFTDNSIFLPIAGRRNGMSLVDTGSDGYGFYWSNSLNVTMPSFAWILMFDDDYDEEDDEYYYENYVEVTCISRSHGFPVRPVCP